MELVDFLRARLDEDERIAEEAGGRRAEWRLARPLDDAELGDASWLRPRELRHAERHDPARVLAEVEAGRVLLQQYERLLAVSSDDHTGVWAVEVIMRAKARVYRAHPDFDPAWLED